MLAPSRLTFLFIFSYKILNGVKNKYYKFFKIYFYKKKYFIYVKIFLKKIIKINFYSIIYIIKLGQGRIKASQVFLFFILISKPSQTCLHISRTYPIRGKTKPVFKKFILLSFPCQMKIMI